MSYMPPVGSWSGTTTTNSSYSTNAFVVAWSQPPSEDDGGGALVGAKVPSPPFAPTTGATTDLQT